MLPKRDLDMLRLVKRFLEEGLFTLKGKDMSLFECRIWLKDFLDKQSRPPAPPKIVPLNSVKKEKDPK